MLVDGDWYVRIMQVERDTNQGKLQVATLIHIWVDWLWAPRESSVVLGDPGVLFDHPKECHPGSKGS